MKKYFSIVLLSFSFIYSSDGSSVAESPLVREAARRVIEERLREENALLKVEVAALREENKRIMSVIVSRERLIENLLTGRLRTSK